MHKDIGNIIANYYGMNNNSHTCLPCHINEKQALAIWRHKETYVIAIMSNVYHDYGCIHMVCHKDKGIVPLDFYAQLCKQNNYIAVMGSWYLLSQVLSQLFLIQQKTKIIK